MRLNFGQFITSCVQLILRGKSAEIRNIVNAFNDPDEQLAELKRLIELGPHVVDGMLLAFRLQEMRPQPLNLEAWPHNVLTRIAGQIESGEDFASLLSVVEETVKWEDTFECVTKLCYELSADAIKDIFIHSERFGRAQPFILSNILRILSGRDSDTLPEASEVIKKARRALNELCEKETRYKLYLEWGGNEGRGEWLYPNILRALSTMELMAAINPNEFPADYEQLKTQSLKMFYQAIGFVNWKDTGQFIWVFKRMLHSLGGNEAFFQWSEMMRKMGQDWAMDT